MFTLLLWTEWCVLLSYSHDDTWHSWQILQQITEAAVDAQLERNQMNHWKDSSDGIQRTFECCGIHNYTEWSSSIENLPASCCPASNDTTVDFNGLSRVICSDRNVNRDSCSDALRAYFKRLSNGMGAFMSFLTVIWLMSGIFGVSVGQSAPSYSTWHEANDSSPPFLYFALSLPWYKLYRTSVRRGS